MVWLLGLVLILQTVFDLLVKPIVAASTPFFEFKSLGFFILLFIFWLFSGRKQEEDF